MNKEMRFELRRNRSLSLFSSWIGILSSELMSECASSFMGMGFRSLFILSFIFLSSEFMN